ncbi:hypothetical protein C8Q69DRAFT_167836 [Paecilomyces variotii]|uniref:Secreted protein n=1 Tax=Byssochlamys spectabilis TaxID=264951 RepID=A0A443I2Q5_BYSSP|nr:hypothetical protein C8Q69DRAFT_167836 [Paecilomyces variotii]RWQ98337.1 hypothetical protein C8Q69DRAFT_167836 [Paecilomyces variotii]
MRARRLLLSLMMHSPAVPAVPAEQVFLNFRQYRPADQFHSQFLFSRGANARRPKRGPSRGTTTVMNPPPRPRKANKTSLADGISHSHWRVHHRRSSTNCTRSTKHGRLSTRGAKVINSIRSKLVLRSRTQ